MLRAAATLLGILTLAATGTPPPEIYHVVTRPFCAQLRSHVLPAVGMILESDRTIQKSVPLFERYRDVAMTGEDRARNTASTSDTTNYDSPARSMALMQMDQLVGPLSENVLAGQRRLASTDVGSVANAQDRKRLQDVRDKLLEVLAAQSASLDIINGFVETQRLGDMQHAGEAYIKAIDRPDTSATPRPASSVNPVLQDPNQPGLAPNPYMIDPASIPGLQVGYNPLSRLMSAAAWLRERTRHGEDEAAVALVAAGKACDYQFPSPSP